MLRTVSWLLAATALACAHPPAALPEAAAPAASPAPAPSPSPSDTLTLHRTACSGHCPVYTLALTRGGQARYRGEQDVGVVGEQAWRVDPLFSGYLFSELERSAFLALGPRYPTEVEEFPGLVLTLGRGGAERQVQLGGPGTEDLPRDLAAEQLLTRLALTLDKLTGSARFVQTGPRAAGGACTD